MAGAAGNESQSSSARRDDGAGRWRSVTSRSTRRRRSSGSARAPDDIDVILARMAQIDSKVDMALEHIGCLTARPYWIPMVVPIPATMEAAAAPAAVAV